MVLLANVNAWVMPMQTDAAIRAAAALRTLRQHLEKHYVNTQTQMMRATMVIHKDADASKQAP